MARKKNVLLIGSGKRMQETVIPALWCLKDKFQINAICSKTKKTVSLFEDKFHKKTMQSFREIDFRKIDLIMMAVTTRETPKILKDLSQYTVANIVLMIDTPVLDPRDISAGKFFLKFKKVLVSEDNIALPHFILSQKLIRKEKIGRLKRIYFFYNGYKYHALASLKRLAGNTFIKRIQHIRERGISEWRKEITFKSSVKAIVHEPRNYKKCWFRIKGDKGDIVDYEFPGKNIFRIKYRTNSSGSYEGLNLNGKPCDEIDLDRKYKRILNEKLIDPSLMNTMKIRGLLTLINAADEKISPYHYSPVDGITDNLAIQTSERLGFYPSFLLKPFSALLSNFLYR